MNIINLENISKVYGSGDSEVKALDNVSLKINKGELIAIIGKSGSGKSTLLNIIGHLDSVTTGNVIVDNIKTNTFKKKEIAQLRNSKFGFVVQHFALINDYTVYDNIELPLKYGNVKRSIRKELINNISEKLGIIDKLKYLPNKLSGGQCQRVAIARALVNNPDIILADEPTGALDVKTGVEVMNIFKSLKDQGKTLIIVTHDESIAIQCERIIEIRDGHILSDKTNI